MNTSPAQVTAAKAVALALTPGVEPIKFVTMWSRRKGQVGPRTTGHILLCHGVAAIGAPGSGSCAACTRQTRIIGTNSGLPHPNHNC
jgi:hypothetical protein